MPETTDFCPSCKSSNILYHSFIRDCFCCKNCGRIWQKVSSKTGRVWTTTGQIGGDDLKWLQGKKNA